jgi:hypothetical protein
MVEMDKNAAERTLRDVDILKISRKSDEYSKEGIGGALEG